MRFLFFLLCFSALLTARADAATITVCYNYGCTSQGAARFDDDLLERMRAWLGEALDAQAERDALTRVIGELYRVAGEQTPISADRGGNIADGDINGRMDCIDHSTTTTRMLKMLEAHGFLRFHRVQEPIKRIRFVVMQHASAVIEELASPTSGAPPRYVVDSWYFDNGEPAVVLPLEQWLDGDDPDV